jgi:hypothetical protein
MRTLLRAGPALSSAASQLRSPQRGYNAPMPRRQLLLVAIAALVLVGVGLLLVWRLWPAQPTTAITRQNATMIREGMTLAEVESLLSGPQRDDSTGPLDHAFFFPSGEPHPQRRPGPAAARGRAVCFGETSQRAVL